MTFIETSHGYSVFFIPRRSLLPTYTFSAGTCVGRIVKRQPFAISTIIDAHFGICGIKSTGLTKERYTYLT